MITGTRAPIGGAQYTPPPAAPQGKPAVNPASQQTPIDLGNGLFQVGNQVMQKNPDGSFTPVNQITQPGQVVNANALGRSFNAAAAPYAGDFDRAFGQQMSLADSLNKVINDVNAPSVAAEQEKQALQANENTQLSGATGASGANAAIARTNAANNIAGLDAKAAQDAGLRRAAEVAGARAQLGTTLATAAGEASGMYGHNTGLGLGYNQLATSTAAGDLANKTAQRGQNLKLAGDVATGAGSVGAAAATGGGSEALQFTPPTDPDGVATLTSDERVKHGVRDESDDNEESFLRALSPKSFEYNGQTKRRSGVMAQDVEKGGPIGRGLVKKDRGGTKGLDVAQGLGAALSALAYLHKRVEELEGDRG